MDVNSEPIPDKNNVVFRSPGDLKNHLLGIKLFGELVETQFRESIAQNGIITPVTICKSKNPHLNDVVICGRRRRMVAVMLGIVTIPCYEFTCDDPHEIELMLIHDNTRNEITVEQKARMFEEMRRIKSAIADLRRKSTLKNQAPLERANLPTRENSEENSQFGRAGDQAARALGSSRRGLETALKVVHDADNLRRSGNVDQADKIIETLNTKSVAAAKRQASGCGTRDVGVDHIGSLVEGLKKKFRRLKEEMVSVMKACDENSHSKNPLSENSYRAMESMMRSLSELLERVEAKVTEIAKRWRQLKDR